MTFASKLQTVQSRISADVLQILEKYLAGEFSEEKTIKLLAFFMGSANSAAMALADMAVASELALQTGAPVAAVGAVPPISQQETLRQAAATILASGDVRDNLDRFTRLATNQVLQAAQEGTAEAIRRGPSRGWVRDTGGTCCQLCEWWSRDDRVWPAKHPMPTHPGCNCRQRPVIATGIVETGYTKRLKKRTEAYESWLAARQAGPAAAEKFRKQHPNYNRQFTALKGAAA